MLMVYLNNEYYFQKDSICFKSDGIVQNYLRNVSDECYFSYVVPEILRSQSHKAFVG